MHVVSAKVAVCLQRIGVALIASVVAACAVAPPDAAVQQAPIAVSSAAIGPLIGQTCGISPEQLRRLETLNTQTVERGYAPGMVTSLFCAGRPLLTSVAGKADGSRALRADDLFRIYSMTKPVTALAAMILMEDGRLNLDDPVAKFLPDFAATPVFDDGDTPANVRTKPLERPISVRDLMRHTAGITYLSDAPHPVNRLYALRGIDHGGGGKIVPTDQSPPVASIEDLSKRIAALPLMHQPGARFTYGNSSDVLGLVVATAAGQELRTFMAARIFTPLGMKDTAFEVPANKLERLTAAHAARSSEPGSNRILRTTRTAALLQGGSLMIEDPRSSIFSRRRTIDFGGAGLVSTAQDYQRFLQMMLNGGSLDGVRIVSAKSVREMTRDQLGPLALAGSPRITAQGLSYGLGFGLFADPAKSPVAVPAGGYFWGGAASTNFWVDPARRISGVVMAQVFGGDVMPFYLEMLDALYGPAPARLASQ